MAAGLPSSVIVAVELTAGVWTAISTDVRGNELEIRVGAEDGDPQPGVMTVVLDNDAGQFVPDNPTSTYYPNFVEGKRIRVQVVKSGTTYTRFVGRIQTIKPEYPNDPAQSVVTVTAVDGLGDLQRTTMKSVTEAIATGGTGYMGSDIIGYWPMNDTWRRARDVTGNSGPFKPWFVSSSSGKVDWAADSDLGPDGQSFVKLTAGKGLWLDAPGMDFANPGRYVSAWVKVNDGSYGEVMSISTRRRDVAGTYVSVVWDASGLYAEAFLAGVSEGTVSAWPVDPGWHHIAVGFDGTDVVFTVDGMTTPTSSIATAITADMRNMSFGGDIDMSVAHVLAHSGTAYLPCGWVEGTNDWNSWTLASTLVPIERASGMYSQGYNLGWIGTPSTARAAAGIRAEGRTAFEVVCDLANTESGLVFHEYSTAATQIIRMVSKASARSATVAMTVDAENDLEGGPTMARSLAGSVAVAVATNGDTTVTAVAGDLLSTLGASKKEISTLLQDEGELYALATDSLAQSRSRRTRLSSLTVHLDTAVNDLYAAFFAIRPGSRLRLGGLPSGHFGLTYIDNYVNGWVERPGVDGYEVEFDLAPADAPPEAVLDDATYGRVAFGDGVATVTGGTAVGITGTGTITITWTGGDLLSTAAGDYPMDFDWNGERVTVTSAPAGGSSPRTLTVTARGVAPTVARVHAAGERIEIWNAAAAAL